MVRLLACWELGAGSGHFATLVPAARALAAMGHESWLASRDMQAAAAHVPAPFAQLIQAPLWPHRSAPVPTLSYGQVIADGGFGDSAGLLALVRAWLALFVRVEPAAIYGDHAPASLLAAHVAGLPAARLGSPFTCPPAACAPALMSWLAVPAAARAGADALADAAVRHVCRALGAPMLDGLAGLLATAPPFLKSWPEFDDFGHPAAAFYGPLAPDARVEPPWPAAPGPRVLVFMPFDRAAVPPLVAALAARGWPAVWVYPETPAVALPGSIRHSRQPVTIKAGAGGTQLVISRGSHAVSLATLAAGLPHLLLPDNVETRMTALLLARQQLGRLPDAWSVESIGALLDALAAADAPERAAAAAVAARHAGHDAAAATARLGRDVATALRLT
jgi:hypothetical protein